MVRRLGSQPGNEGSIPSIPAKRVGQLQTALVADSLAKLIVAE